MSINPSSISFSPAASPEAPEPGPSRKRPRTAVSAEERKEARAHRNRIAAQNSRDRRKAQFSYLERRVSELEEENRQLRAGLLGPSSRSGQLSPEEQERQQAKDRENEELRERIKTLEQGWEAVMKALAAQGLATTAATSVSATAPSSNPSPPTTTEPPVKQPSESLSPTFPALEPTMTFPISPAPSHSSLDFELDLSSSSSSSFVSSPVITPKTEELDSTRHLAAGGLELDLVFPGVDIDSVSADLITIDSPSEETAIDDATMESLFREILVAPSPRLAAANLPFDAPGGPQQHLEASLAGTPSASASFPPQVSSADGSILGLEELVGRVDAGESKTEGGAGIWTTGELEVDMSEMDRIFQLLPAVDAAYQTSIGIEDLGLGLTIELGGEIENIASVETALVGAF